MTVNRHISMADLKREFRRAVQAAERANYVPGRLGKQTGTATWVYDVNGGRGWKYVQILAANGESASITQALNEAGVSDVGNLPIWLNKNMEGKLVIVGQRFTGT